MSRLVKSIFGQGKTQEDLTKVFIYKLITLTMMIMYSSLDMDTHHLIYLV